MDVMKRLVVLLCLPAALLCAADLSTVRSVYVMPMHRGLDQYLANRLTNEHLFQVVTDPKLADTIFTDRIGEGFQTQLEILIPTEAPVKEIVKETEKEGESKAGLITDTVNKLDNPALTSSFGRGKGTVFLVDAKSRQVVWSTFEPPPNSGGKEMDKTAADIVNRIMKDMGRKKK